MSVDAVYGGVKCAVLIPLYGDLIAAKKSVFDFAIWLDPIKTFSVLAPKRAWIFDAICILTKSGD